MRKAIANYERFPRNCTFLLMTAISASAAAGRILIDDAMGRPGRRLTWSYEIQQITTAIALVESGIGIAIVPRLSSHACLSIRRNFGIQ
jgi:hypothetical protein